MNQDIDDLAIEAKNGSKQALEKLVFLVQDRVYNLATRMLVNPEDAYDATQEILILIITKLSTFKGESQFNTWLYRVATNYLLNAKKVKARELGLSFEMFKADLENGLVDETPAADDLVLLNELRVSCTMAMLLCLDLNHRIAYILGDILEFEHVEAANIMEISPQNYRKRLSRARSKVVEFTSSSCGIVNSNAKCSCPKRLPAALACDRVDLRNNRHTVEGAESYNEVLAKVRKLEGNLKTLKLQISMPQPKCPPNLSVKISDLIEISA